jgi:hypothetical protein
MQATRFQAGRGPLEHWHEDQAYKGIEGSVDRRRCALPHVPCLRVLSGKEAVSMIQSLRGDRKHLGKR